MPDDIRPPVIEQEEAERLAVEAAVAKARTNPARIPQAEMRRRMAAMVQEADARIADLAQAAGTRAPEA